MVQKQTVPNRVPNSQDFTTIAPLGTRPEAATSTRMWAVTVLRVGTGGGAGSAGGVTVLTRWPTLSLLVTLICRAHRYGVQPGWATPGRHRNMNAKQSSLFKTARAPVA